MISVVSFSFSKTEGSITGITEYTVGIQVELYSRISLTKTIIFILFFYFILSNYITFILEYDFIKYLFPHPHFVDLMETASSKAKFWVVIV